MHLGLPLALVLQWSSPAGLTTSYACVLMCRSKLLLPEHFSTVSLAAQGCRLTFPFFLCSAQHQDQHFGCCGCVRRVSIQLHHQPSPEVQARHLHRCRDNLHRNTLVSPFPKSSPCRKCLTSPINTLSLFSSEVEGHRLHRFGDHLHCSARVRPLHLHSPASTLSCRPRPTLPFCSLQAI